MAPAVLVTGGAGFIGSHACKLLARNGFEPVTYDNLSTGHRDAVRWGPLVIGDILDRRMLQNAFKAFNPVAVMHFAAVASVAESVVNPALYYRNNVIGTLALLETCKEFKLENIIFSSSCATYGIPPALPIREETPQQPINPYGGSKLMGEMMLREFEETCGLRHVALRYFNACGADIDGELCERHDPETHLIPRVLMAASGLSPSFELFGEDYPTPDGTCVRDYVHVDDLAEAHLLALHYLLDGGTSLALNVGTGAGLSVRDIVRSVSRITGRNVPTLARPRRPGDPPALYADGDLMREKLGFVPRYSDIDTIIRTAAPHFGLGLLSDLRAIA
ncbi:UDP-L-arabinose 4-epimerase [Microvirga subterranea]|uniref:UDP-glucose 4-epimerase n=2 Tax=Microvirga subterranea TaxID=186651 RepID=A0A370H2E8_9HYPH|nr:UDP-L-arabinose 4-epimerase [Microvirga subterranea]